MTLEDDRPSELSVWDVCGMLLLVAFYGVLMVGLLRGGRGWLPPVLASICLLMGLVGLGSLVFSKSAAREMLPGWKKIPYAFFQPILIIVVIPAHLLWMLLPKDRYGRTRIRLPRLR